MATNETEKKPLDDGNSIKWPIIGVSVILAILVALFAVFMGMAARQRKEYNALRGSPSDIVAYIDSLK